MEQSPLQLTYISLFSGIGGFEHGIHKVFPNAICYGYSEIDPYAIKVYESHYPNHPNLGDIRHINAKKFKGKIDLLIGGSPCQNFSSIGDRTGLKGSKSNLLYQFIRILKECQPKYVILENVKMSSTHQDEITDLLGFKPVLLDSNIVSFQQRKRLFWCNFDISILSTCSNIQGTLNDILLKPNDHRLEEVMWKDITKPMKGSREKRIKSLMLGKPLPNSSYIKLINKDDTSTRTLCRMDAGYEWIKISNNIVRNIHPIERERLQTFPDDWTKMISKSKRLEVLGNAVTCDIIALICNILCIIINNAE